MHKIAPAWKWLLLLLLAIVAIAASFHFDAAVRQWVVDHSNRAVKQVMRNVSRFGDWPEHVARRTAPHRDRGMARQQTLGAHWPNDDRGLRPRRHRGARCQDRDRPRPSLGQTGTRLERSRLSSKYNSFPSGHTAATTAFFGVLFFANRRVALASCRSRFSSPLRACMSQRIICRTSFAPPSWASSAPGSAHAGARHRSATINGGGGGIRTHEGLRPAGFQDRSHQPLDHPSKDASPCLTSAGETRATLAQERLTRQIFPRSGQSSLEFSQTATEFRQARRSTNLTRSSVYGLRRVAHLPFNLPSSRLTSKDAQAGMIFSAASMRSSTFPRPRISRR